MQSLAQFSSRCLFGVLVIGCVACAPRMRSLAETMRVPELTKNQFITSDGARLPVHRWLPDDQSVKAAIIALHGFNDYGNFFADAGNYLSHQGIACYAYDQRGFGGAPERGVWPGSEAFSRDLSEFSHLVGQRYPGVPLYFLGESMGGAVVIVTVTDERFSVDVAGVILSAPAVWARSLMPWYQRALLWAMARIAPGMSLTGQGLGVQPSDNIEMLRALGRDPAVIKKTRVDAIHGVTDLMDLALLRTGQLDNNALVLYGERDEVIPLAPIVRMLRQLPKDELTVAYYENGYHMLLRDLQAETPWQDIKAWIADSNAALPSGADGWAVEHLLEEMQ